MITLGKKGTEMAKRSAQAMLMVRSSRSLSILSADPSTAGTPLRRFRNTSPKSSHLTQHHGRTNNQSAPETIHHPRLAIRPPFRRLHTNYKVRAQARRQRAQVYPELG